MGELKDMGELKGHLSISVASLFRWHHSCLSKAWDLAGTLPLSVSAVFAGQPPPCLSTRCQQRLRRLDGWALPSWEFSKTAQGKLP